MSMTTITARLDSKHFNAEGNRVALKAKKGEIF